jgi:ribosomal protein S12 methylthiotransferase accessory factor
MNDKKILYFLLEKFKRGEILFFVKTSIYLLVFTISHKILLRVSKNLNLYEILLNILKTEIKSKLNDFIPPIFINFKYNLIYFPDKLTFLYWYKKKPTQATIKKSNYYGLIKIAKSFYLFPLIKDHIEDIATRLASDYELLKISKSILNNNHIEILYCRDIYLYKIIKDVSLINKNLHYLNYQKEKLERKIVKGGKPLIIELDEYFKKLKFKSLILYNKYKILNKGKIIPIEKDISPFGVITNIYKLKPLHKFAKKVQFYISTISIPDKNYIISTPVYAAGRDMNYKLSKRKSIFEAIERYSAAAISEHKIFYKPVNSVFDESSKIIGYVPRKDNKFLTEIDDKELYPCVRVKKLLTNKDGIKIIKEFLPVDLIFYKVNRTIERRFYFSNSSGCAAHIDQHKAFEKALFELLERDSIMLAWINKLSLPIIDKKSLPEEIKNLIYEIEKETQKEIFLLDASLDKEFPVIISCSYDKNKKFPFFHMGSSCEKSLYKAIKHSIMELISFLGFIKYKTYPSSLFFTKKQKIIRPEDHSSFYHDPKYGKNVEYFRKGEIVKYNDLCKKFNLRRRSINEILLKIGGNFYIANISCNYAKTQNIKVVRVLSTKLVPIWFGNICLPFEKERIQEIKNRFKYYIKDSYRSVPKFLHPFG